MAERGLGSRAGAWIRWVSPAQTTMRLNSRARQFGGVAPGKGVLGRDPKMPIGAAVWPHSSDFANQMEARTTKSHQLLVECGELDRNH